jgi:transposase InsO family protein
VKAQATSTPCVCLRSSLSVCPRRQTSWHLRLGHPGHHILSQLAFDFHYNKTHQYTCQSCRLGKHVRLPFTSSTTVTFFPFQIIHADVWTSPVFNLSGYKYYLVLLDDYTHYVRTFPMRQKSDVLPILRDFHTYIGTQFGVRLLALQTDNGRKFDSTALRLFLDNHGVAFRLSCPYTSQQNGKAERIPRTVNDSLRTMLLHSGAPASFWAEALATATYVINRRPCRATGAITPFELLFGVAPDYSTLRVFGALCFPNLSATTTHKLCPRSTTCVFLGYPPDHRGYRCYDLATKCVITSRHVVFDEHQYPFRTPPLSTPPLAAITPSPADDAMPATRVVPPQPRHPRNRDCAPLTPCEAAPPTNTHDVAPSSANDATSSATPPPPRTPPPTPQPSPHPRLVNTTWSRVHETEFPSRIQSTR